MHRRSDFLKRAVFQETCATETLSKIEIAGNGGKLFLKYIPGYSKATAECTLIVDRISAKVLSIQKIVEPDALSVHVSRFPRP